MTRILGTIALSLLCVLACAQPYPSQVIKLVNPYAAGGPSDLLARELGRRMAEVLGQPVIVENKPGGGATIGAEFVARAKPDGYTIGLLGSPALFISPALQAKPSYDGLADFTPICIGTATPSVIVAHPSLPIHSIRELVEYAKANPGKLSFGSPGNGSLGHLLGEMIKLKAGVNLVHVPYKGGAPATTDLVAGHIGLGILQVSAVMDHVRTGRLRAIAMGARQRSDLLPDLPSVYEAGFTGFDASAWTGLYGPRNLPRGIVDTLYHAMAQVTKAPDLKARLFQQGVQVMLLGPEETLAHMREDHAGLAELIRKSGLRID